MLLQIPITVHCVQNDLLSTTMTDRTQSKFRTLRLRESELVSNPWVAGSTIAGVPALGNTVCKVFLLEQDHVLLRCTVEVLVPVCCKEGRIASAVQSAEVVILPCLRIVGWSLTFEELSTGE